MFFVGCGTMVQLQKIRHARRLIRLQNWRRSLVKCSLV